MRRNSTTVSDKFSGIYLYNSNNNHSNNEKKRSSSLSTSVYRQEHGNHYRIPYSTHFQANSAISQSFLCYFHTPKCSLSLLCVFLGCQSSYRGQIHWGHTKSESKFWHHINYRSFSTEQAMTIARILDSVKYT